MRDILSIFNEKIKPSIENLLKSDTLEDEVLSICKELDIGGTIALNNGISGSHYSNFYRKVLENFNLLTPEFEVYLSNHSDDTFNLNNSFYDNEKDDYDIYVKFKDTITSNVTEINLLNQIELAEIDIDDIKKGDMVSIHTSELLYNEYLPLRIIKNFKDGKATISYWENDPDEIDRKMTQYLEWTMEQNQGDLDTEDFGISPIYATCLPSGPCLMKW